VPFAAQSARRDYRLKRADSGPLSIDDLPAGIDHTKTLLTAPPDEPLRWKANDQSRAIGAWRCAA
jgi:hypothetical protein